jgi:endoglucanase
MFKNYCSANDLPRLKGVNLGGWFSQIDAIEEKDPKGFLGIDAHMQSFMPQEHFARIQKWGFNHIRLPLDYFNFFDEQGELIYATRMDAYEKAVIMAAEHGLFVILDLHKCPGHDFFRGLQREQKFFTDLQVRAAAKKVWTYLAERFGTMPHVLLEILNEPTAQDDAIWDEVKNEFVAHIRKYAPKSPIVVGSNRWNAADTFANLTPAEDDNILYSFHYYNPIIFTHQLTPWNLDEAFLQVARPYPGNYVRTEDVPVYKLQYDWGQWNIDRMRKSLDAVLTFRQKFNLPVACNEFGVFVQTERKSQLAWMSDFMDILKEFGIGFSYWNYKNLDFGIHSDGESLHKNLAQYQNADKCDEDLVALLLKG